MGFLGSFANSAVLLCWLLPPTGCSHRTRAQAEASAEALLVDAQLCWDSGAEGLAYNLI